MNRGVHGASSPGRNGLRSRAGFREDAPLIARRRGAPIYFETPKWDLAGLDRPASLVAS